MGNSRGARGQDCRAVREQLEEVLDATGGPAGDVQLPGELPMWAQSHAADCGECSRAIADFAASRALLRNLQAGEFAPKPLFASRVMAAIAERELELSRAARAWTLAVPRLASQVAWASAVVILAGSTWVFVGLGSSKSDQSTAQASAPVVHLFDTSSTPASQDEVLDNLAERNP